MTSKCVLIHYNAEWVEKEGNDTYDGCLQPVFLPDNYTVEDVMNKAEGALGFMHGPAFHVYGLLFVPATGLRKRLMITSEETFKTYVSISETSGATSFFTIKSGEEVKENLPPLTPSTADGGSSVVNGHTPLTQHSNPSSSRDNESNNKPPNGDSGRKERTSNPKARRRLEPAMTPAAKKMRRLHDSPSTPAPLAATEAPEPLREMNYDELVVGNTFKTKEDLRLILAIAKIKRNFEYKAEKSDSKYFIAKCADSTCKWRLRAVVLDSSSWWKITRMNDEHTCIENKRTDPKLRTKAVAAGIAHLFKHKFNQCDSVYTPKQLIKDMKDTYGVVITYRQAYSGCKRGIELIRGSPDESYQYLVNYSYMLSQLNEGTVTEIKTDENDRFLYYFFAFGVSLRGFKGSCRPAFAVDGTALTGERKGVLLSAIGYDANEQSYPLAFGIVDSENNDSWEWFLRKLCDALGREEYAVKEDLVIASDRKESIPRGISLAFPAANQVFCIHHISENIKKRYHNNGAAVAFIRAAKAFNNDDYEKAMRDLGLASKAALQYVRNIGPEKWARVHATTDRFTLMTTNACETFNSVIKDVKGLPICHLVDFIRSWLMKWFNKHREEAFYWPHYLTRHAHAIIQDRWHLANKFVATHVSGDQYEVEEGENLDQHSVFVEKKSCTCRVVNYQHLPCAHILAVCQTIMMKTDDFCGAHYTTDAWRAMYEHPIFPVLSSDTWNVPKVVAERVVLPPDTTPDLGRRSISRYRSAYEKRAKPKKKRACSRCHEVGHYANGGHCPKA